MTPALRALVEAAAQEFYRSVETVVNEKQFGMLLLGMAFNRLRQYGVTRTEVIEILDKHWTITS